MPYFPKTCLNLQIQESGCREEGEFEEESPKLSLNQIAHIFRRLLHCSPFLLTSFWIQHMNGLAHTASIKITRIWDHRDWVWLGWYWGLVLICRVSFIEQLIYQPLKLKITNYLITKINMIKYFSWNQSTLQHRINFFFH